MINYLVDLLFGEGEGLCLYDPHDDMWMNAHNVGAATGQSCWNFRWVRKPVMYTHRDVESFSGDLEILGERGRGIKYIPTVSRKVLHFWEIYNLDHTEAQDYDSIEGYLHKVKLLNILETCVPPVTKRVPLPPPKHP